MVAVHRCIFAFGLIFVMCGSQFAGGTTLVSPEKVMLTRLAVAIKVYPLLHSGQRVTTWAQVREVYDLESANKSLLGKPSYPLEEHYEFVAQKVAFPEYKDSEVIMVRTVPLQRAEGKAKWRYLVGQTKDGSITAIDMPEEEVRAMFQQAGVPLPIPKPGLPLVELEVMPKLNEPPPNVSATADATPTHAAPTQAATPITQAPTLTVEQRAPVWPWVVGIFALIVIVTLASKPRA